MQLQFASWNVRTLEETQLRTGDFLKTRHSKTWPIYIYLNSIHIVYTIYIYIHTFPHGYAWILRAPAVRFDSRGAAHPCRTVKNLTTHTINIHTHDVWTWKPNWTWMPTPNKLVFNPIFDLLKVYHSFLHSLPFAPSSSGLWDSPNASFFRWLHTFTAELGSAWLLRKVPKVASGSWDITRLFVCI